MSRLDPNKLTVEYRDGASPVEPVINRKYTLTHSDLTAELFLTIGLNYAFDQINFMRDEVLGEWVTQYNNPYYFVYLYVGGPFDQTVAEIRDAIFRRELPLALEAIRYGDRVLFETYPILDQVPIIVHFESSYPQLNTSENWGTFEDYNILIES